ncbi:MAG: hypothetical protein CMC05_11785 [Flavobacteriaceae bacterium]|nr:hypothetical protein [Flavobacteriaceae bacterium]|tara:strand:+ start:967 stop:1668 length:702 start_codon:yes stop_codon:yes gene_type:complete
MGDLTLENMIQRIWQPAVFFYPRNLFEKISGKDLKVLDDIGMTNSLIVRNSIGKLKPFESTIEGMLIINRKELLDSNTFEILKISNSLDKESFLYFLNKYIRNLDAWLRITEITQNNAKDEATNYLPTIQSYLELQHRNTLDHKADLDKRFGEWRRIANFNKTFNVKLPTFEEIINRKPITIPKSISENPSKNLKPKKPPTRRVKTKKTDTKAIDAYLLINVFNLDSNLVENG